MLERLGAFGPTVLLTDGDVVFQPRKIERSGLGSAVDDNVRHQRNPRTERDMLALVILHNQVEPRGPVIK